MSGARGILAVVMSSDTAVQSLTTALLNPESWAIRWFAATVVVCRVEFALAIADSWPCNAAT